MGLWQLVLELQLGMVVPQEDMLVSSDYLHPQKRGEDNHLKKKSSKMTSQRTSNNPSKFN